MNREYRQRISAVVSLGRALLIIALLYAAVGFVSVVAAASIRKVQSPRALSQQPVVRNVQPPIPTMASAASAAFVTATNRPLNVSLAWDASPDQNVSGYRIYWGAQSGRYTNSIKFGPVLTGTISNLARATKYYFAATAYATNGIESPFSAELIWPQPVTNYVVVGIKTNDQVLVQLIYTNPPGDVVLFAPFIWQTNNFVTVSRLNTGNLIVANTNTP